MGWYVFLLLCAPLALTAVAWVPVYRDQSKQNALTLYALIAATINAVFALTLYVRIRWFPSAQNIPPWEDSLVLDSSILALTSPFPLVLGLLAKLREAPWVTAALIVVSSIPLLLFGCAASISV